MTKLEESLFENVDVEKPDTKADELSKTVDLILSENSIDQKGRLTKSQIRGIIKAESLNEYLKRYGKYINEKTGKAEFIENRVLTCMVKRVKVLPISLQGKGRDELIRIVEGFGINIRDETGLNMKDRLAGR